MRWLQNFCIDRALGAFAHILLAEARHVDKPEVNQVGTYTPSTGGAAYVNGQGVVFI